MRSRREASGRKAIISTMANTEPALMPMMPESAMGFFVFPCITAPATASETPTIISASRRGRRMSRAITCLNSPSSKAKKAFRISDLQ